MSSNDVPDSSQSNDPGGLEGLLHLDPALTAALVTVITSVAALFGVELTNGKATLLAVAVLAIVVVAAQLWARRKTIAKRKVLAFLPNPVEQPRLVQAGPAVTTASDYHVLNAVRTAAPS